MRRSRTGKNSPQTEKRSIPIRRTEVFISAASADLKGARALVKSAVDTIGCHGFYQEEFPPDFRKIEEMLRRFIEKCDAVIHIVGVCYGSEPRNRPSEKPRRSFTQMEYDIAQELGRPLYVFVCDETFPYNSHSTESNEAAALQLAHRRACLQREEIRETVATTVQLEKRVSQLHEHLRRLERQIFETSDAIEAVAAQVGDVRSLQRFQNEKLDNQGKRSILSLRADLRAKMNRAQELDARDERKPALALLEEVYHAARSHRLRQEQLEAVLSLGLSTSGEDDFKSVTRRFGEAEKLIQEVKGAWHQIQFCRLKAKVLVYEKQREKAESVLQKAIVLSHSTDSSVLEAGLLARADYIHLLCDAKRPDEADEPLAFARAVVDGAACDHPIGLIAELLEACIHWAISRGDVKQINEFVAAALRHGAEREAALSISHALQHCANGARGMKATNAAVICADAATRLGHIAQRPAMALAAAYTAACALAENEDFHGARQRCLDLVDAAKAVDEPKLRFCVFQLLSQTSRQLGDKTTAVDAAEIALRATEGDGTEMCLARMALGEALRDSGRAKEAMEHAQAAHRLSEHCTLPPEWVDQTLVLIADCAARLGDWSTAESYTAQLGRRALLSPGSKARKKMLDNRIQMHKMIRDSLISVINASAPLSLASGLRQAECRLSSERLARLTFSRISEALAVQMKGFGLRLCLSM